MINNNVTIDSPDRCRHKNVLKVVSGSEFLRSIVMRDILTSFLPSFFSCRRFHFCFSSFDDSLFVLLLCHLYFCIYIVLTGSKKAIGVPPGLAILLASIWAL